MLLRKKILTTMFLMLIGTFSAYSAQIDFNLGVGTGLGTGFYKEDTFQKRIENKSTQWEYFIKNGNGMELAWNINTFLGVGALLQDNINAVGFEWSGRFESFVNRGGFYGHRNFPNLGETQTYQETINSFSQFMDFYYRLNWKINERFPLALQFNFGYAHRILLENQTYITSHKEYNNGDPSHTDYGSLSYKFDGEEAPSQTASGLHVGVRFDVHMFFIGLDYAYYGNFYSNQESKVNFDGNVKMPFSDEISKNQITVNMGVTLNRSILNSFLAK